MKAPGTLRSGNSAITVCSSRCAYGSDPPSLTARMAERLAVDMERGFSTLRNHARNHNRLLIDVARDVIRGSLNASALIPS